MNDRIVLNLLHRRDKPIEQKISQGITEEAESHGYTVINGVAPFDPREEVKRLVNKLGNRVAGIIIQPYLPNRELAELLLTSPIRNFPNIIIGHYFKDLRMNACVVDNYGGMYAITEHLLKIGRKRPCFLGDIIPGSTEYERFLGFSFACLHRGILVPPKFSVNQNLESSLEDSLRPLFEKEDCPDALVCMSDILARDAIEILQNLQIQVPQDCAVVSFGDDYDIAEDCDPPLTTVVHPAKEMGQIAMRELHNQIEAQTSDSPNILVLPVGIRLRESCGTPPEIVQETGAFYDVPFSEYVGVLRKFKD